MYLSAEALGRIASDSALHEDFDAICDTGGRLSGTESERRAMRLVAELGAAASGVPAVSKLALEVDESEAATETLLFDVPGQTDAWVVLSAHVDGHDLAESAMDNASGVAAALAVVRAIAPHVRGWRRGLRLAFFSV